MEGKGSASPGHWGSGLMGKGLCGESTQSVLQFLLSACLSWRLPRGWDGAQSLGCVAHVTRGQGGKEAQGLSWAPLPRRVHSDPSSTDSGCVASDKYLDLSEP